MKTKKELKPTTPIKRKYHRKGWGTNKVKSLKAEILDLKTDLIRLQRKNALLKETVTALVTDEI